MDAQPESAASGGVPVTTPEFAIQPNDSHKVEFSSNNQVRIILLWAPRMIANGHVLAEHAQRDS